MKYFPNYPGLCNKIQPNRTLLLPLRCTAFSLVLLSEKRKGFGEEQETGRLFRAAAGALSGGGRQGVHPRTLWREEDDV